LSTNGRAVSILFCETRLLSRYIDVEEIQMARKKLNGKVKPAIYAEHLQRLGLSQINAGRLFHQSDRTGQRWAAKGPPLAVVMVLSLYDDPKDIEKLAAKVSEK
jgi:hypothetical protein